MWIALKLLASGALDRVLRGLSAALDWLLSDWRNMALAGFAGALAWLLLLTIPHLRADLVETAQQLEAEQIAHRQTIANVTAASAEAQRRAEANAARVRAEQKDITDATVADYRADLAALRARFDRLRANTAAAADPRDPDAAGLPRLPAAAGRAAAAPAQDRLPPAAGLTLDDALIASEQALQLNALIDWVEGQAAVRFTPEDLPR